MAPRLPSIGARRILRVNLLTRRLLIVSALLISGISACVGELALDSDLEGDDPPEPRTYGFNADLTLAGDLKFGIMDHEQWPSFTGLDGMQQGTGPHGIYHKFFLSPIAESNTESFGNG